MANSIFHRAMGRNFLTARPALGRLSVKIAVTGAAVSSAPVARRTDPRSLARSLRLRPSTPVSGRVRRHRVGASPRRGRLANAFELLNGPIC